MLVRCLVLLGVLGGTARADRDPSAVPLWQKFLPVSVSIGAGAWLPSWGTFDRFREAYGEAEAPRLQGSIDNFETAFIPRFGIKIGPPEGISLMFYGSWASTDTQARFGTDERREFHYSSRTYGMEFKFGLRGALPVAPPIELTVGGYTGSAKLTSGYRYNEDTLSFGLDKVLNGQFRVPHFAATVGIGSGVNIGSRYRLFAQANWIKSFTSGGGTNDGGRLGIKDRTHENGFAPSYTNVDPTVYLPSARDELYDPDVYHLKNSDNIVDHDVGGVQLLVGIELRVTPW